MFRKELRLNDLLTLVLRPPNSQTPPVRPQPAYRFTPAVHGQVLAVDVSTYIDIIIDVKTDSVLFAKTVADDTRPAMMKKLCRFLPTHQQLSVSKGLMRVSTVVRLMTADDRVEADPCPATVSLIAAFIPARYKFERLLTL